MVEHVASSRLARQPVGEAALVAEGVYQLKVPVPIPLVFVSAYLTRADEGRTLMTPASTGRRGGPRGTPGQRV